MFKIPPEPYPKKNPTKSITNVAIITTTRPMSPVEIFFLAFSSAPLSLPDEIIPIAPVIKTKINQMMATIVITPIMDVMKLANVPIPVPPVDREFEPIPVNLPPGGVIEMSAINLFIFLK